MAPDLPTPGAIRIPGPAVGVLELESLAKGVVVTDALLKKARIVVGSTESVSPGKYIIVFSGPVAEVDESFREGVAVAGSSLIDSLYLPQLSEPVRRLLAGAAPVAGGTSEALGLFETHTVSSALLGADVALKRAAVTLTHLHLARGIGGKGWFTLSGTQADVEAALEAASAAVGLPRLKAAELIARPHAELKSPVHPA